MIPPTYVITLNKTLGKQGEALREAGLDPILFKGVDGRKGEHKYYENKLKPLYNKVGTKSSKGCSLSHLLLCEKLYKEGIELALILENDAYPFKNVNLSDEIEKVINEVPDDWEIIKLHCDMFCEDGSNLQKSLFNGSAAAYLINTKGFFVLNNTSMKLQFDNHINIVNKVYKSKKNLFWADESYSTQRGSNERYIFEPFLNFLFPIKTGEKTWGTFLNSKWFTIPFTTIEVIKVQILTFIFVVTGLIIFYYINK
jgi:hypothetical protein